KQSSYNAGRQPGTSDVGHPSRHEPQGVELRDVELQRNAALQTHRDRHREGVHHTGQGRTLLAELDEDLAQPVVRVGPGVQVTLGTADGERDRLRSEERRVGKEGRSGWWT